MTLEDFERDLAESQAESRKRKRDRSHSPRREGRRHHHRHSHHHDHSSRGYRHGNDRPDSSNKSYRRSKYESRKEERGRHHRRHALEESVSSVSDGENQLDRDAEIPPPTEDILDHQLEQVADTKQKRDDWMLAPSALDVDYVQRKRQRSPPSKFVKSQSNLQASKQLDDDVTSIARSQKASGTAKELVKEPAQHEVSYLFGDAGSSWRMTKLKGAYKKAEDTGRPIDDVALEQYDDLRAFDDAREEETELDRRKMYGKDYVGKEKPSGDLFQERKLDVGIHREHANHDSDSDSDFEKPQGEILENPEPTTKTVALDQTALNKLKAQMMKAKLMKTPNAAELEAEYTSAMSHAAGNKQSDVVVLNKMESRMLAGGRKGEVKDIENKRGRERGKVEENEDMSIEDMVRQEKRTRGQFGGNGKDFAERIAKDGKFDVSCVQCSYMSASYTNVLFRTIWTIWTTTPASWQDPCKSLN